MEAMARSRTTYSDEAEDMSEEAREMKGFVDTIVPLVGVANLWDYLPVLRWLDVRGVRRRLADAVNRRNAFIYKLIDKERQKQLDGAATDDEEQSTIGVMLSLQNSESELYTDTFIAALVAVSRNIHISMAAPCFHPCKVLIDFLVLCLDGRIFLAPGRRRRRRRRSGQWRCC